jgi:hypothetical protein
MYWLEMEVRDMNTIVEETGARKTESGRTTLSGSVMGVAAMELALELSGMRDCGGVSDRLESLDSLAERESTSMLSSILAVLMGLLWR